MPVIVKCSYCNKEKKVKPSKLKIHKKFFCNYDCKTKYQQGKPTWNKGLKLPPMPENQRIKIRDSCRKNEKLKKTQFKKGQIIKKEWTKKRIETIKKTGCLSGEKNGMYGRTGDKNPNWQGGISYWRKQYYNSIPYKEWQKAVFKRDNYTCQKCGSTKCKGKILHAHHKKSFARYSELRLVVDNGLTLCDTCHNQINSKKASIGKVLSVEVTEMTENMIDIEVADNNNFFANGILVHNSASPYREDGRTNLIFALTGYPTGLDWGSLIKILGKHYHDVNVYIVANETAKISLVSNLLNKEKKTIIFVNELAIGEKIANGIGIPFIHGQTKNRMELARDSKVFVASRVMELGVSLKDLEHIIEVDFLGGRREKVQRTGRLLHSETGQSHDIIMTKEEFDGYGGRSLHGLIEKGFKINLKPKISGSFKLIKQETERRSKSGKRNSSDLELVTDLWDEGFFRTEKTFGEVCKALEKRGMTAISHKKGKIFSKLNTLVSSKKLYKDTNKKGKVFVMR